MSKVPTNLQISAGGVAYREREGVIEVALISVGEKVRWQLPKGLVESGEAPEAAAIREVREEAGIVAEPLSLLEKIEYWFWSTGRQGKFRIHKYVYFYLLRYISGDVQDHDWEVNEARWVEIGQAGQMLSFDSERKVLQKAAEIIPTL